MNTFFRNLTFLFLMLGTMWLCSSVSAHAVSFEEIALTEKNVHANENLDLRAPVKIDLHAIKLIEGMRDLRPVAEWEKPAGVFLAYARGNYSDIANHILALRANSPEIKILVLADLNVAPEDGLAKDSELKSAIEEETTTKHHFGEKIYYKGPAITDLIFRRKLLEGYQVPKDAYQVVFHDVGENIWVRDQFYIPVEATREDGSKSIVAVIPEQSAAFDVLRSLRQYANQLVPKNSLQYPMDLEGGMFATDGEKGCAVTEDYFFHDSGAQRVAYFKRYLGCDVLLIIHSHLFKSRHTDLVAKYLPPKGGKRRVLLAQADSSVPKSIQDKLLANRELFLSQGYDVVATPLYLLKSLYPKANVTFMSETDGAATPMNVYTSYVNSLFVGTDTLYIPVHRDYAFVYENVNWDHMNKVAKDTYRKLGFSKVVPIEATAFDPRTAGGVHCFVQGIYR